MNYEKTLKKICRLPKVTPDLIVNLFKKDEGIDVTVVSMNIGKPGFEIITDLGVCFVTERKIDHYNKTMGRATLIQERMLKLAIPIPLHIGLGTITQNLARIYKSKSPQKEADLWLYDVVTIETALAYYNKYFSVSESLKEYKTIIFESIEAFNMGLENIAIMSLIPVFEGGLRNIQNIVLNENSNNVSTKKYNKGLKNLILIWGRRKLTGYAWHPGKDDGTDAEIDFLTHICPQSDVINAFRLFFKDVLYKSNSHNIGGLNRHIIVHMLRNDFKNPTHFFRLLLALTHITFIESLYNPNVPFHWQGIDEKDKKISEYIRLLQLLISCHRRPILSDLNLAEYGVVSKTFT